MELLNQPKLQGFQFDDPIEPELDEGPVNVPEYWITSYGIDYDVVGIVRRLKNGDICIPRFQRGFVWDKDRSSRFIESLLLRLPVPGIFLYREADSQKQIVIDGLQRLLTLRSYYDGKIADKEFALTGLAGNSPYNGRKYTQLDDADRRKLDDSVIHATVIRQDKPDDGGSSQYAIFERLNTNATPLTAQEIRAAIYNGAFNKLLIELNENPEWRKLFGNKHKRRRDEELILRFLALYYQSGDYRHSMKGFLNSFMNKNRYMVSLSEDEVRPLFNNTVSTVINAIGPKAFRLKHQVNAALFDSVMVGVARRLKSGSPPRKMQAAYERLVKDDNFLELLDVRTSSKESVTKRLQMATEAFACAE